MAFEIGDKVIYPNHGLGVIERIETKTIMGTTCGFYQLRMANETTVFVPVDNVDPGAPGFDITAQWAGQGGVATSGGRDKYARTALTNIFKKTGTEVDDATRDNLVEKFKSGMCWSLDVARMMLRKKIQKMKRAEKRPHLKAVYQTFLDRIDAIG